MHLGTDNTSIIYFILIFIPLISIFLSRREIISSENTQKKSFLQLSYIGAFAQFNEKFFITFVIVIPFLFNFSWLVLASFAFSVTLFSILDKKAKLRDSYTVFLEKASPYVQKQISVVMIVFLGLFLMMTLISVETLISRYIFNGSAYLVVALSIVLSGFVALIENSAVRMVSRIIMGIVSITIIIFFTLVPSTNNFLGIVLKEVFYLLSLISFIQNSNELLTVLLPLGIILFTWWSWLFNENLNFPKPNPLNSFKVSSSVLFLVVVILSFVIYDSQFTIYDGNAQEINLSANHFPLVIAFSFLLFGSFIYLFSLIKQFSLLASSPIKIKITPTEKSLLFSRLTVVTVAASAILLYPVTIILSERIVLLNLFFIASFITPITSLVTLFAVWEKFSMEGISFGITSGLLAGGIIFIFSIIDLFSGSTISLNPVFIALLSFLVTMMSSIVMSIVLERMKRKSKLTIPLS